MKDGFLKIALAAPKIRVADPKYNASLCVDSAKEACKNGAKVLLFPELTLSSATAGDLFWQTGLVEKCEAALDFYISATAELDMISFIGLPVRYGAKLYDAMAAVCKGELLGLSVFSLDGVDFADFRKRYFAYFGDSQLITLCGRETLMGDSIIYLLSGKPGAKIFVELADEGKIFVPRHALAAREGANLILSAMAYSENVSVGERERARIISTSDRLAAAYAVCCASFGESGTDGVFAGRRIISELGDLISEAPLFSEDILYGVADISRIDGARMKNDDFSGLERGFDIIEFSLSEEKTEPNAPWAYPFVPRDKEQRERAAELALKLQSKALAGRIERAGVKRCVIGVSGGLDSTLAVLVAEGAMELLGRDKKDVIAITMPCFGTSERTKGNALSLAEELGLSAKTIDIKEAVNLHFRDIGQSKDSYDVVYENSQARERTQILMDIANKENGLVVGTGDLSELALGFATYNGDQMSMYSVNGSVPKTLMREIIRYSAKCAYKKGKEALAKVLLDVIETPVSPELLPTENGGENTQYTETIVGPYELHDFFLYYTVKYGFSAEKIKRLATAAFQGKYSDSEISACLERFIRRFVTQQFKRSCMPDGPAVTEISLSPRGAYLMPSDASFAFATGENGK